MLLKNAVVLVTGANRGIGAEFVAQLKERGAAKIYAASRDASAVDVHGVEADPARHHRRHRRFRPPPMWPAMSKY